MNGKNSISIWALVLALTNGGALLADPLMSSLQIGPQAPDPINPGGSATYAITITKTNSGPMDIYLSTLNLPTGAAASFSPNPVGITKNATSGTATLVISTTNTIPPGHYSFSVVASDGGSHNSMTNTATLDVGVRSACLTQMTNGCWCYTFPTQPGLTYQVQATCDLASRSWTTLCTTNCGTNYLMVFMDTDKTVYSCRFYRAVGQ